MPVTENQHLETLLNLIRDVKPSLVSTPIKLDDSLVENLGLDSLDITQLARKARRVFGHPFDPQAWVAGHGEHNYSVKSLLQATGVAVALE
jgi:acyl carrier protein